LSPSETTKAAYVMNPVVFSTDEAMVPKCNALVKTSQG